MKDEQRLTQMKREFDALKIELGVLSNERDKIKKELKTNYKIVNSKEVTKLISSLEEKLAEMIEKRDALYDHIELKLKEYRR